VFCRCRFVGGASGLAIGREQYMGSESLIMDCNFERCGTGVAVLNYNALSNNLLRCLARDCGTSVRQFAGSFNVMGSRFEGAQDTDLTMANSALDAFWITDTSSTSSTSLAVPNTGALINVLFEGFRHEGDDDDLIHYLGGGSLTLLDADLGAGTVRFGGNCAHSALLLLRAHRESDDQIQLTHPRAYLFVLDGPAR
jgi:hypothetical protein